MSHAAQRTAFVFAGGGSLGAVQVGMLRELMHAGVSADLVAAVTAGMSGRSSGNWSRSATARRKQHCGEARYSAPRSSAPVHATRPPECFDRRRPRGHLRKFYGFKVHPGGPPLGLQVSDRQGDLTVLMNASLRVCCRVHRSGGKISNASRRKFRSYYKL